MTSTQVESATNSSIRNGIPVGNCTPARILNDVHFSRKTWETCDPSSSAPPQFSPFPRLPAELRLQIWRLAASDGYRLLLLNIHRDPNDRDRDWYSGEKGFTADEVARYYAGRNDLGKVVSGRGYALQVGGGRENGEGPPTPLARVGREARSVAFEIYRVRLPYLELDRRTRRVLYLNPEYDVLQLWPAPHSDILRDLAPAKVDVTLIADFLHDVKAYDPKDRGIAHIAVDMDHLDRNFNTGDPHDGIPFWFSPSDLHPTAASSFADMLRSGGLRSLLITTNSGRAERYSMSHIAKTFPLRRPGSYPLTFDWLEHDPRPRAQADLCNIKFYRNPSMIARAWRELETAFGVDRTGSEPHGADDDTSSRDTFRLYMCPSLEWLFSSMGHRDEWREVLPGYLSEEEEQWKRYRWWGCHSDVNEAYTSEELPDTVVGMWVIPLDTFEGREPFEGPPPVHSPTTWNLADVRPGLILFEV